PERLERLGEHRLDIIFTCHIGLDDDLLPAGVGLRSRRPSGLSARSITAIVDRDVSSLLRKPDRDGLSNARRRSCNEGVLAFQSHKQYKGKSKVKSQIAKFKLPPAHDLATDTLLTFAL